MKKHQHCVDCNSEAVSYTIKRKTRYVTTTEIAYSCGARRKEYSDLERNTGRAEFEGCGCGAP
ncbi:hypothetical protein [Geomesophilobacter sediminis]|uniref:Uncharacterized protein n=1 Tax=Geomesophilobacter sediminis TaxID=2798584 RepID=A0A8J7JAM2_9BACT|nr:hypothetical protein [Geomesophilobacter sediminis]MBJ6723443.1 hypothetical protein [Geomesophilobacter sediminis]